MSTRAALVAALLVASALLAPLSTGAASLGAGPAGGVDAVVDGGDPARGAAPVIVTVEDSSNYLAVPDDDVRRADATTAGLDVGGAVAGDVFALSSAFARDQFAAEYREAETDAERSALVTRYADTLRRRLVALQDRDRAITRAYANGSMPAGTFLRERGQIYAEARYLQATTRSIQRTANQDIGYSLPTRLKYRLENVKYEFEVLRGPVTTSANRAANGTASSREVYVEASDDGYTMATINDGEYVRETYLGTQRQPNGTDQFAESDVLRTTAAVNRVTELYPWVSEVTLSPSDQTLGSTGIYRHVSPFPGGELKVYLDGGTTNAFRESLHQSVSSMPIRETDVATNGSLQVTLNRTYETGPMQVSLARNGTGVATAGQIEIGNETVARTGSDGSVWIVEPRRPYTANVTAADGDRVSVRVDG